MTSGWRSTGQREQLSPETIGKAGQRFIEEVELASQTHEHYWLVVIGFRVDPTAAMDAHGLVLDHENIRVAPNLGCFICELSFRPELVGTRCEGEPS